MTVTILPEWEEELDILKKEVFYNASKSELIRYLIKTGLNQIKKENCTLEIEQGDFMKREQTTIRLPVELKEKLQQEAMKKGYTIKDLIVFIIRNYFLNIQPK